MFSSEWVKKYTRSAILIAIACSVVGLICIILYCMLKAPVYNYISNSIARDPVIGWMVDKKSSTSNTIDDYVCASAALATIIVAYIGASQI
jgi:hypothetical protein